MIKIPHPIPYQGSKRKISPAVFSFIRGREYDVLYEPFAGSGAFTLYAATHGLARRYVLGDSFGVLMELWKLLVNYPEEAASRYKSVWLGQMEGDHEYFNSIRRAYNENHDPIHLLYLVARCVKNAVRFNKKGDFTQSADKRRKGMKPETMRRQILGASALLKGRVEFFEGDFADCVSTATSRDLVYMDPPYQGTTYGRDKRYYDQLEVEKLFDLLGKLNAKKVDYLLSYDGKTGKKSYGISIPSNLGLSRVFINAGRSSQATLSGRQEVTLESLYISREIAKQSLHVDGAEYLHSGQKVLVV